jgi:hypothetical protein
VLHLVARSYSKVRSQGIRLDKSDRSVDIIDLSARDNSTMKDDRIFEEIPSENVEFDHSTMDDEFL